MTAWTGRRVLVTGGAGFVGSHLVDELLQRGISRVTVLDDLSSGLEENLDQAHRVGGQARVRLTVGSALDRELVDALVREADAVFHLAALVGVARVMGQPSHCHEVDVPMAEGVFAACSRWHRPLLFTSSSEVYGGAAAAPMREDDPPPRLSGSPRWCYGRAKRSVERRLLTQGDGASAPVVVARLFNTVGPRQRADGGMVLPRFVAQAVAGKPIRVHGTGLQARTFLDVRDCARALAELALHPAARGRVVNVGGRVEIRIRELAERVRRRAGSRSEIRFESHAEAYGPGFEDVDRRRPHLSRLEGLVDWTVLRELDPLLDELIAAGRARTGRSLPDLGVAPVDRPARCVRMVGGGGRG